MAGCLTPRLREFRVSRASPPVAPSAVSTRSPGRSDGRSPLCEPPANGRPRARHPLAEAPVSRPRRGAHLPRSRPRRTHQRPRRNQSIPFPHRSPSRSPGSSRRLRFSTRRYRFCYATRLLAPMQSWTSDSCLCLVSFKTEQTSCVFPSNLHTIGFADRARVEPLGRLVMRFERIVDRIHDSVPANLQHRGQKRLRSEIPARSHVDVLPEIFAHAALAGQSSWRLSENVVGTPDVERNPLAEMAKNHLQPGMAVEET